MTLTQAEALSVVSLDSMKTELRIPLTESEHDALLSGQITSAADFVMASTGSSLAGLTSLRPAIIAAVRVQYDGNREVTPNAAHNAWMDPYKSYAG